MTSACFFPTECSNVTVGFYTELALKPLFGDRRLRKLCPEQNSQKPAVCTQ